MPPKEGWPTRECSKVYTIGWIAALPHERAAAIMMLDERHNAPKSFRKNSSDPNEYSWGAIGEHNIAIASLPSGEYGLVSAADTAGGMAASLPQIRVGLLVGIGAGITSNSDILLGDVVVSDPDGTNGGVVQYDMYKAKTNGIERKGFLDAPPRALRAALGLLKTEHEMEDSEIESLMERFHTNKKMRTEYAYPGNDKDPVRLASENEQVRVSSKIHYGTIASGNVLLKDTQARNDILARLKEENVNPLCFEMEAAGLMNKFPCLVIRGICDYADQNKSDRWQRYAAGTAAAFAREFLGYVTATDVEQIEEIGVILDQVIGVVEETNLRTTRVESKLDHDRLYNWLSPKDNYSNYAEALRKRHPGTGSWFLNGLEFARWKKGGSICSFLWLHGLSGCGKTVLSTSIIEHLESRQKDNANVALAYFYFDFNDVSKSTFDAMARSLVWQIARQVEIAATHLNLLFRKCEENTRRPTTEELLVALFTILEQSAGTRIVVDALDECSTRAELLSWLKTISTRRPDHVQIIVTSRPEHEFEKCIGDSISPWDRLRIEEECLDEDIKAYVRSRIQKDGFERWSNHQNIRDEIEAEVVKKSHGMFRLAACQLDELDTCLDYRSIKTTLAVLPETLNGIYELMLKKILPKHRPKAIRILQFLAYTEEPLLIEQIVDVVEVSIGTDRGFDPANRMPDAKEVALICPGLTSIVCKTCYGEPGSCLQLSHSSVRDYLFQGEIELNFQLHLHESAARLAISKVSLVYFLSLDPAIMDEDEGSNAETEFPFRGPSARLWMTNYAQIKTNSDSLLTLAMELFTSPAHFMHWLACYNPERPEMDMIKYSFNMRKWGNKEASRVTAKHSRNCPIYCASLGGLTACVKALLQQRRPLDSNAPYYAMNKLGNPLREAVSRGHNSIIKLLIENGALDEEGASEEALDAAADRGDLKMAEFLISQGARIRHTEGPLITAVINGNFHIVKLFLENGARVNQQGYSWRWAALSMAAQTGHMQILEFLIAQGADVNVHGGDSLSSAANGG